MAAKVNQAVTARRSKPKPRPRSGPNIEESERNTTRIVLRLPPVTADDLRATARAWKCTLGQVVVSALIALRHSCEEVLARTDTEHPATGLREAERGDGFVVDPSEHEVVEREIGEGAQSSKIRRPRGTAT